ncbi:MAG: UvrD-helicase domain-containing protein [Clostridia bacterium]|nr:UvrD-helicase domain-containing protein [Clostridia bacterium]
MDLSMLNPEQRLAADTLEGPVLVLAGAGSGKTRALTYRVANLMDHGVPAWTILCLTFTNKAAKEMKTRIAQLVGEEEAEEAWISTFHSVCARILRRDIEKLGYTRSFVIYDDDDQMAVLKEVLKRLNIDDSVMKPRDIKSVIGDAKNKLLSADEWFQQSPRDFRSQQMHTVFVEYEHKLKSNNALDFDDLLIKTLTLFADHPPVLESYRNKFRYVMVDEYQDTNPAQYHLVKLLTDRSRNLCVVGDDDQSIYGWRGADIRNILDFEKDYPDARVIKLEQNYRSTANILDAANQVIAHNTGRKEKALWTEEDAGEKIRLYTAADEREEAAWVANRMVQLNRQGEGYGKMAILYRTNAQSRVLEEMLMRAAIPYKVFGGQKFYDRKEVKDIIAYLRIIVNPADDVSLRRIINVPKRAIGDSTVEVLAAHAAANDMPLFSALADLPESLSARPRKNVTEFMVLLSTLMAMKEMMPLEEFVETLINQTGLMSQYQKEDNDEARARVENIQEFMGAVSEFAKNTENATLEDYLENVSLVTDLDRADDNHGFVTLMTLHSAKGLEFPDVFITGLEEGIFPSSRSVMDEEKVEEERRLAYVGITRARERLFITRARRRMLFNQMSFNAPSRFLDEMPDRVLEDESDPFAGGYSSGRSAYGTSGGYAPQRPMPPRPASMGHAPMAPQRPAMPPKPVYGSTGSAPKAAPRPKLTLGGQGLNIPGVQKGFVPSPARETGSAMQALFNQGDKVMHNKFGEGRVVEVKGSGSSARIRIEFMTYGVKEFALAIAPIVKLED